MIKNSVDRTGEKKNGNSGRRGQRHSTNIKTLASAKTKKPLPLRVEAFYFIMVLTIFILNMVGQTPLWLLFNWTGASPPEARKPCPALSSSISAKPELDFSQNFFSVILRALKLFTRILEPLAP